MNSRRCYRFGSFMLLPAARELLHEGKPVSVPSRVFDCIVYLVDNRDRAIGRDELGAAVWDSAEVSDAQLSQAILRARRAVDQDGQEQSLIRTIPKFGYAWDAPVEAFDDVSQAEATVTPDNADEASIASTPVLEPRQAQPESPRRKSARMRALGAGVALLIVLLASATWWFSNRAPDRIPVPRQNVLILPLDVETGSNGDWIRLGAIDTIANRMRMAGVSVPPAETTLALLGADPAGIESTTLRERSGAEWIVSGHAGRSARGWRVTLKALGQDEASHLSEVDADDVLDALHSATDTLLIQLGYVPPTEPRLSNSIEEPLQRIRAALLENDLAGARHIVDNSPALSTDPSELRFQLALIDYREGHLDAATTAARSVLVDESTAKRPGLKGRAQVLLGSIDLMLDKAAEAEPIFADALTALNPEIHALDYARALAGRGAARVTLGRYDAGLDDIGRARALLQQSGDLLAQARIDMLTGSAELLRRRPRQARALLEPAVEQLARFGAWNERMHAYAELVQCDVDMLDYKAAEAASDAGHALMEKVENPLHRAETLLYRAQLRAQQGRLGEADELLGAFELLGLSGHARLQGLAHALRAHLAAERGEPREAIREASSAIDMLPENESEMAARTILLRTRARLAIGESAPAASELAALPPALLAEPLAIPVAIARNEVLATEKGTAAADRESTAILARAEGGMVLYDQLLATESRLAQLLERGDTATADSLLGRLAPLAGQDYRFALMDLRLSHAENKLQAWKSALERASRLAGERPIPPDLRQPPLG